MPLYQDDPLAQQFDGAFSKTIYGPRDPVAAGQGDSPLSAGDFDIPGTNLPQIDNPGFFGRIRQQPGGSRALLALGASLLSSQNFFDGLGKGALAYQTVLDQEQDKRRPQLTKDGTFVYSIDPTTGQASFKRTPLADFEDSQVDRKLLTSANNARYAADRRYDASTYGTDARDRADQRQWDFKDRELDYRDRWDRNRNQTNRDIASLNADNRLRIVAATQAGKPVPGGVLKEYDDYAGKVSSANGTLDLGNQVLRTLQDGTLQLGTLHNLKNKASAATGLGADDSSRAYAGLQQFTQVLVNATLMDARGVQTDGDAERAKIMSLVSAGDNEGAAREIANAMDMLERGRNYHQARATDISRQYGIDTTNTAPTISNRPTTAAPPSRGGSRGSMRQKYGLD